MPRVVEMSIKNLREHKKDAVRRLFLAANYLSRALATSEPKSYTDMAYI